MEPAEKLPVPRPSLSLRLEPSAEPLGHAGECYRQAPLLQVVFLSLSLLGAPPDRLTAARPGGAVFTSGAGIIQVLLTSPRRCRSRCLNY
jgi:hypothetical protein